MNDNKQAENKVNEEISSIIYNLSTALWHIGSAIEKLDKEKYEDRLVLIKLENTSNWIFGAVKEWFKKVEDND